VFQNDGSLRLKILRSPAASLALSSPVTLRCTISAAVAKFCGTPEVKISKLSRGVDASGTPEVDTSGTPEVDTPRTIGVAKASGTLEVDTPKTAGVVEVSGTAAVEASGTPEVPEVEGMAKAGVAEASGKAKVAVEASETVEVPAVARAEVVDVSRTT